MMLLQLTFAFAAFLRSVYATLVDTNQIMAHLKEKNDIVAFYNVYAEGSHYKSIVQSQVDIIAGSGLLGKLNKIFFATMGISGKMFTVDESEKYVHIAHYGDRGSELQTLSLLYKFCHYNPSSKVVYFHDKGSLHNSTANARFCSLLNCYVLNTHCIDALDTHDTCGWRISPIPYPHYSGNFWWARCDYVNTLIDPMAAVNNETFVDAANHMNECIGLIGRHFAETWIGTGPSIHPADCMNSTIDSSYVWGYKVPAAADAFCHAPGVPSGLPCQTASTLTHVLDFKPALMQMSARIPAGRCRDNQKDIIKRSQMMYGEDPRTYMKWMNALHAPLKLPENALIRFTDNTQVYINKKGVLHGVPNLKTFMTFGKEFSDVKTLYAADKPSYRIGNMLPSA